MPTVLLVVTQAWSFPARLAGALRRSGFRVAAVCDRGNLLRLSHCPSAFHRLHHLTARTDLRTALLREQPDLVIPCDDRAVYLLHSLVEQVAGARGPGGDQIAAVIKRSLGSCTAAVRSKAAVIALAADLNLPVPAGGAVTGWADYAERGGRLGFPHVLKRDGTWGGTGVRVVGSAGEMASVWCALSRPSGWGKAVRAMVREGSLRPIAERWDWQPETVAVQAFVPGRPANCAVVCDRGEILASVDVEVMASLGTHGPATVVRMIDHPDIKATAAALVRRLGLSGFCGFDFILEQATGRALLLELNPRATPTAHLLPADGTDLAGALFTRITGQTPVGGGGVPLTTDWVALFPGELIRDPRSRALYNMHHDVPWDEPKLVVACLTESVGEHWIDRGKRGLARWYRRIVGHPLGELS